MNRRIPSLLRRATALRTVLGAAVLLGSCLAGCNDPNAPATSPSGSETDFRGSYDTRGGALIFRLESPGGGSSPLELVASNLVFDADSLELRADVSILNTGSAEVQGPARILVGDFDPSDVHPLSAEPLPCPACVGCPCWAWSFDHSGTYGGDGVLGPGETSTPVRWVLHVPSGQSFSFRARLERAPHAPRSGIISGVVFADANGNGRREASETGIAGAVVSLLHGESGAGAITDDLGRYEFEVAEEGLYRVSLEPAADCRPTTPLERQVFIVRRPDGTLSGYDRADFGCGGNVPPDSAGVVVHGTVFEDLNRNGVRDRGEPGLARVRIEGAVPRCPSFAPIVTYTDESGDYSLGLIPCPPPYVVQREPIPGFVDTTPNPVVFPGPLGPPPGTDPNAVPGTGPVDPSGRRVRAVRADFGVARADSVSGYAVEGFVYHDANRNGRLDDGETGLADIEVSASGLVCMTPVAGVTRTDARGYYKLHQREIHCVPPWSVAHAPVGDQCDTSPNPLLVGHLRSNGEPGDPAALRVFRADFGVGACDSIPPPLGLVIDGFVWTDLDQDGVREPGEPGIGAAVLELVSPCERLWRAVTDEAGYYRFEVGGCPVRAVVQTLPAFPARTTPNPHPVDLGGVPPNGVVHVDFGIAPARTP